jgi:hypothetical protein
MKQFTLIILLIVTLLSSCKKEETTNSGDFTIKFLEQYNDNEVSTDTVAVASDLSIHYRALISPAGDVASANYKIIFDDTEAFSYDYTVDATSDQGFLIDPITYNINYYNMAGIINYMKMKISATDKSGNTKEAQLVYKIQPVNYPFQFRFYDYNFSDTLAVGQSVTIRPFFSPMTVNQTIKSMKVFEKVGLSAETEIATYGPSDFFYFQVGWLREMDYQVPNLSSGSSIIHRFELVSSSDQKFVLQHSILVQ